MSYQLQPCAFISKREIEGALSVSPSQGKRLLELLKSRALAEKLPINILEDTEVSNEAEVHRHEGDLWQCLEGEVMFVYGGELVEPWAKQIADGGTDDQEIKAKEIRNGTEITLQPGDWLWIPASQPHSHRTEKTARLTIIKIPAKEMVSIQAVSGWHG